MDILAVIRELDKELNSLGLHREIYICGGAALILLKITSRATMDIDVLAPSIDAQFSEAAKRVASKRGLNDGWLNNGPDDLVAYLGDDWEKRCQLVYSGNSLKVFALSRSDLIKTKLWAACDRMEDIPDLLAIKPTRSELNMAKEWVLQVDASEIWPKIVEGCLAEVERKLGDT